MKNHMPVAQRSSLIHGFRLRRPADRLARAVWEGLETRRLLSTAVWTGAGGNALWSNANNWQGNAVPAAGQDVEFDNLTGTGTPQIIQVDEAVEVGSMSIDNTILQGSDALTLDGDVTVGISNYAAFLLPVTLTHTTAVNVTTGSGGKFSDLLLCDTVSDGGHGYGLTVAGGGEVDVVPCSINSSGDASYLNSDVAENYTGQTDITGGSVFTFNASFGGRVIASGNSQVFGSGVIPTLSETGSQFGATDPYGLFPSVLTVTDGAHYASGGLFSDVINGAAVGNGSADTGFSELAVTGGTIDLGGATFQGNLDTTKYTPKAGDVITVIKNSTGHAITGTFANLAEGAHVNLKGFPFVISYTGGKSKRDVTLTAQSVPTIVNKTSSHEVTRTTGTLKVVGSDPDSSAGAAGLKYTWTTVVLPKGAKTPVFTTNGKNASAVDTVRFYKAGTYHFHCTVTNSGGGSATVAVRVVVAQTATTLRVSPHAQHIEKGATLQYSASVLDQFNHSISATPTFGIISGPATITNTGLLTAEETLGSVIISADDDGLMATVGATVLG